MTREHLIVTKTDRGFKTLPHIPATHAGRPAGHAAVWESSAADEPSLWIEVEQPADRNHPDNGETIRAAIHIRAEDAWRFAEQIQHLVKNHYQGDARPEEEMAFIIRNYGPDGRSFTEARITSETLAWAENYLRQQEGRSDVG